jgi:plasmid stabilization system protein ParE
MVKIVWSENALQDNEQISEFIRKDSSDRAALFVSRLIDATEKLSQYPNSGRVIPEVKKDEYREVIYGAYRIMYKLAAREVLILAVIHSARDWKF